MIEICKFGTSVVVREPFGQIQFWIGNVAYSRWRDVPLFDRWRFWGLPFRWDARGNSGYCYIREWKGCGHLTQDPQIGDAYRTPCGRGWITYAPAPHFPGRPFAVAFRGVSHRAVTYPVALDNLRALGCHVPRD